LPPRIHCFSGEFLIAKVSLFKNAILQCDFEL
jgi:hypothetical protein